MKVFLVPPPALALPAVKGGAVETLITHLMEENEIQQKLELVCVSLPDPDAEQAALRYRHTRLYYRPAQPLRQKLYICLCKIVSNHGSPAAGSKFDHINVPFLFLCYPITTLTSCLLPCAITGIRSTFSPSRYNSCTPFITPSGFST